MMNHRGIAIALAVAAAPFAVAADPSLECSIDNGSQVEIGDCVANAEAAVNAAIEIAYGFAMGAARELDDVTERESAAPALETAQETWKAYREAHCDYAGATFGGGSGAGIAIRSCRIELGRERIAELMGFVR